MKALLLTLTLLLAMPAFCPAQSGIADFYQQHKRGKEVFNLKLPGWLTWFVGGIAYNSIRNEETRNALLLAKKIGKFRMLHAEDAGAIPAPELQALTANMYKADYADLLLVREGDTRVNFMIREKNDKIKDLVLLISEEDGFTFLSIKSRLKMEDISRVINDYFIQDKNKAEPGQDKKILSEKRKKLYPQA